VEMCTDFTPLSQKCTNRTPLWSIVLDYNEYIGVLAVVQVVVGMTLYINFYIFG